MLLLKEHLQVCFRQLKLKPDTKRYTASDAGPWSIENCFGTVSCNFCFNVCERNVQRFNL